MLATEIITHTHWEQWRKIVLVERLLNRVKLSIFLVGTIEDSEKTQRYNKWFRHAKIEVKRGKSMCTRTIIGKEKRLNNGDEKLKK